MKQQRFASTDKDVCATLKALRRAARRARELGATTGTPVYVMKGDRIVNLIDGSELMKRKAVGRKQ